MISLKSRIVYTASALFVISLLASLSLSSVTAHNFSPSESASFLSLVDETKSALSSIEVDISSDTDLALQQAQYARALFTDNDIRELKERNQRVASEIVEVLDSLQHLSSQNVGDNITRLSNLLSEAILVRIDKDQLSNSTVHALAFADDIDKILEQYTLAIKGANTSKTMNMDKSGMNLSAMKNNTSHSMNMTAKGNDIGSEIVRKIDSYQRAGALTDIAIDKFNKELKGKSNVTSSLDQVSMGLEQLKTSIGNNASTTTIMGLVHGQIHPNLMTAFDLQLAPTSNQNKGNTSLSMSNMSKHSM